MLFSASHLPLLLGASTLANAFVIPGLQKRDVTAQLTMGSSRTPMSALDGQMIVGDALRKLCSNSGCDAGTPETTQEYVTIFESYGDFKGCKWTVTASGNYDSINERE